MIINRIATRCSPLLSVDLKRSLSSHRHKLDFLRTICYPVSVHQQRWLITVVPVNCTFLEY